MGKIEGTPEQKSFRRLSVLEKLTPEDFDLVKLPEDKGYHRAGQWTLQLGGQVFYHLPHSLIQATVDFTEEEVAACSSIIC